MAAEVRGKIQTVLGLIEPDSAGQTLTHEHLSIDFLCCKLPTKNDQDRKHVSLPMCMENLWWIRQHPYFHHENLCHGEEHEAVVEELKFFKSNGGCTMVENTVTGIDRDINFLKQVSETTGVNVVAGTGYYVAASRLETHHLTQEKMADFMTTEILHGADDTDIKCGVIGEIGCSNPLIDTEKRAVQASAQVQSDLGCPVIIHPGRGYEAPSEIVRIFQEAGGMAGKLVMSHLDRTLDQTSQVLEFAELGCYCEYDLFGIETSHYQNNEAFDMPSDAQRIGYIKSLIEEGFDDRVVIAHDIHTKHRLMKYGGHGYSHILVNVVPKMLKRGITQKAVNKILVDNPREWLTFI